MRWLMFEIGDPKSNVPGKTTAGRKGYRLAGLAGLTQQLDYHQGCKSCSKLGDHEPCAHIGYKIPVGEHRHQRRNASQGITAVEAITMRSALWKAHYLANGVLADRLYNLGEGANNVSQQRMYEIVSASGRTLTLKTINTGNPKEINHGNSIINPDWPGIDPETGEPAARLKALEDEGALQVGAMVVFEYPSVLGGKLNPCVTKVNPPESDDEAGVTFSVEVSHSVNKARRSYDLKYPPADGKYYCTLYYYFTAPESHPNYQEREETQFAKVSKTFLPAAVGAGPVGLTDSDGDPCRIILPSMQFLWHEVPVVALVTDNGRTRIEYPVPVTTDTGSGWATTVDLTEYDSETLEEVEVLYWAEAVDGDEGRRPFVASCANSQIDYSGSYIHDVATGRRCVNVDCDQFDSYRGTCWKPGANGFNLVSSSRMPITSLEDGSWQGRFWEDTTLTLEQGIPGVSSSRNFTFRRLGGPSIGELCGYFFDVVPGGMFAGRERAHGPALGQLREYEPEDGGTRLLHVTGAYLANAEQDATATNKDAGLLTYAIPAWDDREGEMEETVSGRLEDYPTGSVGHTSNYTYQSGGRALGVRCRKSPETEERHVTGVRVSSAEDPAVTDHVRSWF
jgi:hypothetical protein